MWVGKTWIIIGLFELSIGERMYHISEEEVNETIPLLDSNIRHIAESMRDTSVRDSWKNTRSDYNRIEAERCIRYDNAVIAAYSLGTTPIHTFSSVISFLRISPFEIRCILCVYVVEVELRYFHFS